MTDKVENDENLISWELQQMVSNNILHPNDPHSSLMRASITSQNGSPTTPLKNGSDYFFKGRSRSKIVFKAPQVPYQVPTIASRTSLATLQIFRRVSSCCRPILTCMHVRVVPQQMQSPSPCKLVDMAVAMYADVKTRPPHSTWLSCPGRDDGSLLAGPDGNSLSSRRCKIC